MPAEDHEASLNEAIAAVRAVYSGELWTRWADGWDSGGDRSEWSARRIARAIEPEIKFFSADRLSAQAALAARQCCLAAVHARSDFAKEAIGIARHVLKGRAGLATTDNFNDELFGVACLGAKRLGEFLEATHGAQLTEDVSRLREQAKVGLSALVSNLLLEAPQHNVSEGDRLLEDLVRFTTMEFLER